MPQKNEKVDKFLDRASIWKAEMKSLRELLLKFGLEEELKWGKPCYSAEGGNIAIIQPFKQHLSLMFFKGALLKAPRDLLKSQGPNSQSARRLEFQSQDDIQSARAALKDLVVEAVALEKKNIPFPFKKTAKTEIPPELKERFRIDPAYKKAFEGLTPGRQRSYIIHITQAKQEKTRLNRIEKCKSRVMMGKGYNEG